MVYIDIKLTWLTIATLKGFVAVGPCIIAPVHR
jgi:hypothetical protein